MGSSIKNLYEVKGHPLYKERRQSIKSGISGLGPEDLVVLDKTQSAFLRTTLTESYYHQIIGFNLTPRTFLQYYSDLLRRQEQASRIPLTSSYQITQGRYFSWDSFDSVDVRATVTKPPVCEVCAVLADGSTRGLTDLEWKHCNLSQSLRCFRNAQPILLSLFGHRSRAPTVLQTFQITPLLFEDFVYAIDRHVIDDDLVSAIAAGIVLSLAPKEVNEFLVDFSRKIPSVFVHLWKYVDVGSGFAPTLAALSENHLKIFCDDISLTFRLVDFFIAKGGEWRFVMPLVQNAIWSHPTAALCLARIALLKKENEEAFNYINASMFCRHWPLGEADRPRVVLTNPRAALPYRSPHERGIVSSPIVGARADNFAITAKLIEQVTMDVFKGAFIKKMTADRQRADGISSFALWPPANFSIKEEPPDLLALYDPGIECSAPRLDRLANLPYSDGFKNLLADVTHALDRKRRILSGKTASPKKDAEKEDAVSIVTLGLRLRCPELIRKGVELAQTHRDQSSSTLRLLLLKASMGGLGPELDTILQMEIVTKFVNDMNSLTFLENMALAVENLCL
jgi:hypothetical protein